MYWLSISRLFTSSSNSESNVPVKYESEELKPKEISILSDDDKPDIP